MDALATADGDFLNGIVDRLANASAQGQDIDPRVLNFRSAAVTSWTAFSLFSLLCCFVSLAAICASPRDLASQFFRWSNREMGLKPNRIQRLEDYRCQKLLCIELFFEIRLEACPDSPSGVLSCGREV